MTALCLVINLGNSSVNAALLDASGVNQWHVAATLRLMNRLTTCSKAG